MNKNFIEKRVFIVGSPRSGTSLLQSIIGSHANIQSFPESHLFYNLISNKYLNLFGISPQKSIIDFNRFIEIIDKNNYKVKKRSNLFTQQKFFKESTQILDNITLLKKRTIWSEKTPLHLHCIDWLEKQQNNVVFIHIIREGVDVIKSSYSLCKSLPDSSWGKGKNLDYWIARWIQDISISKKYVDKKNHHFVLYSDLLQNQDKIMHSIFDFLNIDKNSYQRNKHQETSLVNDFLEKSWHQNLSNKVGEKEKKENLLSEREIGIINKKTPTHLYSELLNSLNLT